MTARRWSAVTRTGSGLCSSSATSLASIASWSSTPDLRTSCACRSTAGTPSRCAGMRVLLDGDVEEAERLAQEARRAGNRAEQAVARAVLRHPDDSDPQHAGTCRRAPARRARARRALSGHPGLANRPGHPRGQGGRQRAGPAGARPLRRRRLQRAAEGRQLVRGDEPDGGGDRDDRRHASTPSASTSCSSPTRGW